MTHGLFLVYPGSLYLLVDQSLFEIIFSFSSHARIKLVFPSPNIRTEADLGGGCSGCAPPLLFLIQLAPVVQRLDNAIHRINHYPADSVVCFVNTYPLDSDLSGG